MSKDSFRRLVESILPRATEVARTSTLHGPSHWERVATVGSVLAEQTPGADPHIVSLFAAFHDARRINDGHDPDHGKRGAALARELRGKVFEATDEQMKLLAEACVEHTDGKVTSDPTIGACWDSDRLDLPRCGIRPNPALLSTAAAKKLANDRRGG